MSTDITRKVTIHATGYELSVEDNYDGMQMAKIGYTEGEGETERTEEIITGYKEARTLAEEILKLIPCAD